LILYLDNVDITQTDGIIGVGIVEAGMDTHVGDAIHGLVINGGLNTVIKENM